MRLLLLLAVAVLAAADPVPWKNCSASAGDVVVNDVDATPWPPKIGQKLTITVNATLLVPITTGANLNLKVKFDGIQLISKDFDLCTIDKNITCPIPARPIVTTQSVDIPQLLPSGEYSIFANATNGNGDELICLNLDVKLSKSRKLRPSNPLTAPAQRQDIIDLVNAVGTTWTAGVNKRFQHSTLGHVKGLCGAKKGGPVLPAKRIHSTLALPTSFDPRDGSKWPACNQTLNHVRDQGACGSCWAFGAVEAMTDRICIASSGKENFYLSAEDVTSCCDSCGMGCDGGYPSAAWDYFEQTGVVTGGDWNSKQGCFPYELQACDHHVTGKYKPCGNIQPTPACSQQCQNGATWSKDKHFGATRYSVPSDQQSIMTEIYTNGPVEAAFDVYEDFVSYKSGVYQHTTGSFLGGHAVKIIGWGVDGSTPYWIIANSWNTDWGNNGFFNMLRGSDECGIESGIVAGVPKV
jgi:cathepsin B